MQKIHNEQNTKNIKQRISITELCFCLKLQYDSTQHYYFKRTFTWGYGPMWGVRTWPESMRCVHEWQLSTGLQSLSEENVHTGGISVQSVRALTRWRGHPHSGGQVQGVGPQERWRECLWRRENQCRFLEARRVEKSSKWLWASWHKVSVWVW